MNSNQVVLRTAFESNLNQRIGMLRALRVKLGDGEATLLVYSEDFDIDSDWEMFFYPTDRVHFALLRDDGEVAWKREMGAGLVPGIWFCPVYAMDLDKDGIEEIWFVNNLDDQHPLSIKHSVLERLDPETGQTTGQWPWTYERGLTFSHQFRNFIFGGFVQDEPVLVTATGTYGKMELRGWGDKMKPRWETIIGKDDPGARGSHLCPVLDVNGDGVDEVLWGERCIELDRGSEVFCAYREEYRGHSDVVYPFWSRQRDGYLVYTIRESDLPASPRVTVFDAKGQHVWGDLEVGHVDIGWVGRIISSESGAALAVRISGKTCGAKGRFHEGVEEFLYDVETGARIPIVGRLMDTIPVDVNGDGVHELVRGISEGNGDVVKADGSVLGNVRGMVAMACRFLDYPGEQILSFDWQGTVRAWYDENATDSDELRRRLASPAYKRMQRLTAVGYNLCPMAGL